MKRQLLKNEYIMTSIPARNGGIHEQPGDDGISVVVTVQLNYKPWLQPLAKLLKARIKRKYRLEGLGLEVYRMIDGKRNFEKLVDLFADKHCLTFFESRALLMQYLRILMQRGIILMGIPAHE